MISSIPALHTNVIATVRREPQALADSALNAEKQGNKAQSFQLPPDAVTPKVDNDNFAVDGVAMAAAAARQSQSQGQVNGPLGFAAQAYRVADAFSAFAARPTVSLAV